MKRKRWGLCITLFVILISLFAGLAVLLLRQKPTPQLPSASTAPSTTATAPSSTATTPSTEPTVPHPVKESSATISAVGDVLMHDSILNSGYTKGKYDFSGIFSYFSDYVNQSDYAIANLETTLAGSENGLTYTGYPAFNSPDSILSALKSSGFDMVLTANNHAYDTQSLGFRRTAKTVTDFGLDRLGTKETADEPNYVIRQINGIRIAMMCYTYESDKKANAKALNGKKLSAEDMPLVNSFDYKHLDLFYTEMTQNMAQLEEEGADAVILFIHWGKEYEISNGKTQSAIAQRLCDIGIDVIIGGHPHVVQPVSLLTSADASGKTICIYSLGNFISNQRREQMKLKTGHTEDGVMFSITFAKYDDGTVIPEKVDVLPFWVVMQRKSGKKVFRVLPLDTQIEDWKTQFALTDSLLAEAQASYQRTMDIISPGMAEVSAYLDSLLAQRESALEAAP